MSYEEWHHDTSKFSLSYDRIIVSSTTSSLSEYRLVTAL